MIAGFSRMRLLLIAIFAIVGAGIVSPGVVLASSTQPARIAVVAHAVRWTATHHDAHPHDCAARPTIHRDPVLLAIAEDDLVDDDDLEHRSAIRPHLANESITSFHGSRLARRSSGDHRGHPQFDRPRFRTGRGLLRGPPS